MIPCGRKGQESEKESEIGRALGRAWRHPVPPLSVNSDTGKSQASVSSCMRKRANFLQVCYSDLSSSWKGKRKKKKRDAVVWPHVLAFGHMLSYDKGESWLVGGSSRLTWRWKEKKKKSIRPHVWKITQLVLVHPVAIRSHIIGRMRSKQVLEKVLEKYQSLIWL